VEIVEARNRVGGRIYTAQNVSGTSLNVDLGGEFIDTTHTSMRSLTKEHGRYRVSLHSGNASFEKIYERILLAVPYTTLRAIALNVNLPDVKQKAISELGYGTNSKLVTAYKQRLWVNRYKSTAFILTDLDFNITWEATRNHQGKFGLITNFTGGLSLEVRENQKVKFIY
jgi:monoamine oxidase